MNSSESSPLHIFYVEDNEYDRAAFRRAFKKSKVPYKITECVDAKEAFELLHITEMALEDISESSLMYSNLEEIKEAALKATEIAKQLIDISHTAQKHYWIKQ